jgi:hypothetical protein
MQATSQSDFASCCPQSPISSCARHNYTNPVWDPPVTAAAVVAQLSFAGVEHKSFSRKTQKIELDSTSTYSAKSLFAASATATAAAAAAISCEK